MPENSADAVFSDQLIEHLHPEDIKFHLEMVRKILKQRVYICLEHLINFQDLRYFSSFLRGSRWIPP